MAGEIHRITVVVTTLDIQHWHPGWIAAAEAAGAGHVVDWATAGLRRHLKEAADRYISTHPDLFATDADVL